MRISNNFCDLVVMVYRNNLAEDFHIGIVVICYFYVFTCYCWVMNSLDIFANSAT